MRFPREDRVRPQPFCPWEAVLAPSLPGGWARWSTQTYLAAYTDQPENTA